MSIREMQNLFYILKIKKQKWRLEVIEVLVAYEWFINDVTVFSIGHYIDGVGD